MVINRRHTILFSNLDDRIWALETQLFIQQAFAAWRQILSASRR